MSSLHPTDTSGTPETPLQAAVWLARDLGVAMPPIPSRYAADLAEVRVGEVFATSPSLTRLADIEAMDGTLNRGAWPDSGVAFGIVVSGSARRWFYVLVSPQIVLHVSLRIASHDERGLAASLRAVSAANIWLNACGANADLGGRMVAERPSRHRPVFLLSDMGMTEKVAEFSDEDGSILAYQTAPRAAGNEVDWLRV